MNNTVIIGGGAAGLFLAANLKGDNNLLIEGTKKLGQKILITGGGMCNITNMDDTQEFIKRFGDKKKCNFLKPAILNLSTENTRQWLEKAGLDIVIREDGKVFPKSLRAQSVIDILYKKLTENGCKIRYNLKVNSVEKLDSGFKIYTDNEPIYCKKLVFTTGGKSFPKTGSDGSSYNIIKLLGHRIIKPEPALTGLYIENYKFKTISGTSIKNSFIEFYRDGENKRYHTANGDVLFTHKGLSGPGILNNSRVIRDGDLLKLTLIPCENREEKRSEILNLINESNPVTIKKFLKSLGITSSMGDLLIEFLSLDGNHTIKSLNKKVKNRIIDTLLSFLFKVKTKMDFNAAMVTSGGVDTQEINRTTMESKLIPGLYFAGEIIDIDGDTGGYNIQAAFSTAKLISDKLNKEVEAIG
ncbi:NAD(P)/FAD-dependent oxidoreductase [Thiospirochaeta perfilievii]|uniref:NAD(P)/FAD-dependent oxidoreductase n=1 Tax=Thiospirochaeta perfilievii TaxID=252967 RepID=UPI00165925C9|nr:aminoacetone oxidase family FAD-binding enzyme [Thiospirochaeta perfilievii]